MENRAGDSPSSLIHSLLPALLAARFAIHYRVRRMIRLRLNRILAFVSAVWLLGGCVHGPVAYRPNVQPTMDRRNVDYPAGFELKLVASGFTAPVAEAWDLDSGTMLVAEAGIDQEPRIYAIKPDFSIQAIYPFSRRIPFSPVQPGFQIYGPIGGMVVDHHKIYVSHRDREGFGVITEFGFDGSHRTITAGWPSQGDFGITDLAIYHDPTRHDNDKLFFCVGSATNSGIVGLDNVWLRKHRNFCDRASEMMDPLGLRSLSKNPFASLFTAHGGEPTADTGPFQPFGTSDKTTILPAANHRPNSVVGYVMLGGGDMKIVAHNFRCPRGMAFSDRSSIYFSNDGCEMRGSRPVKDDRDAIIQTYTYPNPPAELPSNPGGADGGFPDFSTDFYPLSLARFQPPLSAFPPNNVPKVGSLFDHHGREPVRGAPDTTSRTLVATFPSLSGAAKMCFAPSKGPFSAPRFRDRLFVALSGDRAPFATGGAKLLRPVGYKVVTVDTSPDGKVEDLIFNVPMLPASKVNRRGFVGLERPVDVKIGPDGSLYVLDMGEIDYRVDGRQKVSHGTGKLFRLVPVKAPTTQK